VSRRVLLISHHHPALVRGGGQQVCYELFEALQQTTYEPILLASVQRNLNPSLFKSGAAISGFEGRKNEYLFMSHAYDHVWLSNREPVGLEKFETFLRQIRPDVIHFHHFIYVGLEFITAARRYLDEVGGRLIFTLHEYLGICLANGQMVRTFDKSLCETPSPVRCNGCFPHLAPEVFSMRRMWIRHHFDMVDLFVAPSRFLHRVYLEWGLPPEKIIYIPYGHKPRALPEADPPAHQPARRRRRFAYFGQLIDNKGLLVLLDAIRMLRSRGADDFTVEIHGANLQFASEEFRKSFQEFFAREAARSPDEPTRTRLRETYELSDLARLMAPVDWVIVPSIWWENSPLVIAEAFMFGKPVICSNIGGMRERVRDDVDGLHFVARDSESLADVMARALNEEGLWERLHANTISPPTAEAIARQHIALCYRPSSMAIQAVAEGSDPVPIAALS